MEVTLSEDCCVWMSQSMLNAVPTVISTVKFLTSGVNKFRAPGHPNSEFCAVAYNVCWSSAWNILRVVLLVPRIFRLDFCKIRKTPSRGAQISGCR